MINRLAELIDQKEKELSLMKSEVKKREKELSQLKDKQKEAEALGPVRRAMFEMGINQRIAKVNKTAPKFDDVRSQKSKRKDG